VGRKLVVAVGVGWLSLAIAACGGGGHPADGGSLRSADNIVTCLNRAGLAAEKVEEEAEAEIVGAHAPDGDTIVIVNMSEAIASHPGVSYLLTQRLKKELHRVGRGGIITTSTVNQGSTYIGVLGVEGIDGGVAATSTELLARHCAIKASKNARAASA
jgi:hypothetical protein